MTRTTIAALPIVEAAEGGSVSKPQHAQGDDSVGKHTHPNDVSLDIVAEREISSNGY